MVGVRNKKKKSKDNDGKAMQNIYEGQIFQSVYGRN